MNAFEENGKDSGHNMYSCKRYIERREKYMKILYKRIWDKGTNRKHSWVNKD